MLGCLHRAAFLLSRQALLRKGCVTPLCSAAQNFSPLFWGEVFQNKFRLLVRHYIKLQRELIVDYFISDVGEKSFGAVLHIKL